MPTARQWQLQEAKSKLSQLVREAENGPQTITHHGRPSAVVISIA
ncbi:MAG: type II toxin-antitoxin system prevent-host-death family antitoxin, partial [Bifidobacteriaceae bacterium]|nr:type II toxin-antitoxin system prevent-host-death family antitoxin [Bifidobacteriaceae bacterium]